MLYQTHAQVHLDRLRHNLQGIREAVGKTLVLMAVKADAYGHGAVEVARFVEREGLADWFGVATVPEGIELREAGIGLPILKLSHAFPEEMEAAVQADLTLAVVSGENVVALQETAERLDRTVNVHLKVDTGMARIGVAPDQAAELAAHIEEHCPNLVLQGIFTHLPVSDTPGQNDFTRGQIALFAETVARVEGVIGREIDLVHCSNSGAVLGHEYARLSMVRPGIMTYGYYPDAATPKTVDLQPVLTWHTRISFLKPVRAGSTVGYGRTWTAQDDTWVATLPVGYADGYSRALSSRGTVLIGGRRYPVVGRVCMDQLMVDVGPEPAVAVGDEVVLLGTSGEESYDADDMARDLETISYEITCDISRRVTRHYVG